MKKISILALLAAAFLGFALWWYSPTQVLQRRTKSFLSTISLDAGKGTASRQMTGYALHAFLAPQIELENPTIKEANGNFERAEIESGFSLLSSFAKQTSFRAQRFESITVSGDTAEVQFILDGLVELPTYRPVDGIYQVTLAWRKESDGWKLTRASWRE